MEKLENIKVKYNYIIDTPYEDLADGSPNFHHVSSMKVSHENGTLKGLLDTLSANSKIGIIRNFSFEIIELNGDN